MVAYTELFHRLPTYQMFLNDAFQHRRITLAVPRSLGIDNRDRTTQADAQTVGFGAVNATLSAELKFIKSTF